MIYFFNERESIEMYTVINTLALDDDLPILLVVMVIIADAMRLSVMATTGGTERMQLHSSTKQIAANLRYTRAHAIATGEPQRFTIDPRGHAWPAPNGRHGTVPEALELTFTGARPVQPQAGLGAIMFFDDGASTGGRVQLAHGHTAWNHDVGWMPGAVTPKRARQGRRARGEEPEPKPKPQLGDSLVQAVPTASLAPRWEGAGRGLRDCDSKAPALRWCKPFRRHHWCPVGGAGGAGSGASPCSRSSSPSRSWRWR